MINLPNLDDQKYTDIVEAAKRRIPVIFPEWTDMNEHDPGITLIELFAWLKEMQQYTLNRIPDRTREALRQRQRFCFPLVRRWSFRWAAARFPPTGRNSRLRSLSAASRIPSAGYSCAAAMNTLM